MLTDHYTKSMEFIRVFAETHQSIPQNMTKLRLTSPESKPKLLKKVRPIIIESNNIDQCSLFCETSDCAVRESAMESRRPQSRRLRDTARAGARHAYALLQMDTEHDSETTEVLPESIERLSLSLTSAQLVNGLSFTHRPQKQRRALQDP